MVTLSDGVVTLRPWTRSDAGFLAQASADPDIQRYNGELDRQGHPAPPPSTADAEAVIDEFEANWRAFTQRGTAPRVAFATTDARTGELAGCCGVDDWSKADVAQIGYWIAPEARRHGFAGRAAVLLKEWLFEQGAARVFLTIVAGNEGSVAVARRAGFVHEGTMRAHGVWQGERHDVLWFAALPVASVPTLFLTVGLPGSGKTTAARQIEAEHHALRLTKDEWVKALYGQNNPPSASDVIEGRLIEVALRALGVGTDVVLDFGLWSRDERSALRHAAAEVGAAVDIRYFEIEPGEQRRRLDQRLADAPSESWPMSDRELAAWASSFDIPTSSELDGSEPVGHPPDGLASWTAWLAQRWPRSVG